MHSTVLYTVHQKQHRHSPTAGLTLWFCWNISTFLHIVFNFCCQESVIKNTDIVWCSTNTIASEIYRWKLLTEDLVSWSFIQVIESYLAWQSIKYSPEQFPGEMKLFIWRGSEVSPASSQAVILPTALIVIGQQLGKVKRSFISHLLALRIIFSTDGTPRSTYS